MENAKTTEDLSEIERLAHNLHGRASAMAERLAGEGEFDAAGRVLLIGQRAYHSILDLRVTHRGLFLEGQGEEPAAKPAKGARAAVPCVGGGRHKWGPDNRCTREGCNATNPRQTVVPGAS